MTQNTFQKLFKIGLRKKLSDNDVVIMIMIVHITPTQVLGLPSGQEIIVIRVTPNNSGPIHFKKKIL